MPSEMAWIFEKDHAGRVRGLVGDVATEKLAGA
jgi:hypothetical protein